MMRQDTGKASREFIESIFETVTLSPDALDLMDYLRPHYKLAIISGSFDIFIRSVAKALEIKDWYANAQFLWDDKGYLRGELSEYRQGEMKVRHLGQFLATYHLTADQCLAVGDGRNDRKLFNAVRGGIAIGANSDLLTHAVARIDTLSELKTIL